MNASAVLVFDDEQRPDRTKEAELVMTVRAHHTYPGSGYLLPADEEERDRLNLQHRAITALNDGHLLANGIVEPSPGDRVLDAGVGTCIWALELSSNLPASVTFTGIDISTRFFPKSTPPNIAFEQRSILELPAEWHGTFSLVHQRLLKAAFTEAEWKVALRAVYDVLKPGGQVQLTECGQMEYGPHGSATATAWETLLEMYNRSGSFRTECVAALPGLLAEAGFVDIKVTKKRSPVGADAKTEGEKDMAENMYKLMCALKGPTMKNMRLSAEEFDGLMKKSEEEYRSTSGLGIPWYWYTARKPL